MTTASIVMPPARWLGDHLYPGPLSVLGITDRPQIQAPKEWRNHSHLRLCFTFRLQRLKGFYF